MRPSQNRMSQSIIQKRLKDILASAPYNNISQTQLHSAKDKPKSNTSSQAVLSRKNKQNQNNYSTSMQTPTMLTRRPQANQSLSRTKSNTSLRPDPNQKRTLNPSASVKQIKSVEPFVPIQIPSKIFRTRKEQSSREHWSRVQQPTTIQHRQPTCIDVVIQNQKSSNEKQCLRKLAKKVQKLTRELQESDKEKLRLQILLQNREFYDFKVNEYQKTIRNLELENHKLRLENLSLSERIKSVTEESQSRLKKADKIIEKTVFVDKPVEIIKHVPVQKIVEVQVEVPKLIPGPQRIIEKPKYIDREVVKEVIKQVSTRVEVPVQVPIEVPIYVDRPVHNNQMREEIRILLDRVDELELQLAQAQTAKLTYLQKIQELLANIEILRRHNEQKNREVEMLIQNSFEASSRERYSSNHTVGFSSVKRA